MACFQRNRLLWLVAAAAIICACSPQRQRVVHNEAANASALLPKTNVVDIKVLKSELLGKSFMPGGTLARYQNGKSTYEIFLGKLPTATDSAIALAHWDEALKDPKVIRSLDAYYGLDAGRPVYVFARGQWIAGITGLPEAEADQQARMLAGRL